MSLDLLQKMNGKLCACGKVHSHTVANILVGAGVISKLPDELARYAAKKIYLLCDQTTYRVAGERVQTLLQEAGVAVVLCVLDSESPAPNEYNVGYATMFYDHSCEAVVAVGSGVVNDIGKIVAAMAGKPYLIVGTAPSMDGYASPTSSMTRANLKISLNSKTADVIIGDTDILCKAPTRMLLSGLGDMIAKYVSICEWRIAHIISGEYYCEEIAALVRVALKRCVENAEGLLRRDVQAVQAVFEGLVITGVAMTYAGVSRPASGVEHYLSHVWDMREIEFGTAADFHGIQCAIGSLIAARCYEKLKALTPDKEKALAYAAGFDGEVWSAALRKFLGKSAESMIALEKKEGKYNLQKHAERLPVILNHWQEILQVIDEELPSAASLEALLDRLGAPKAPAEIGIDPSVLPMTFKASKDIRDKYVLPRLAWDLGVLDEIADAL